MSEVVRSLALFVAASLAKSGGGWLVRQWLREGKANANQITPKPSSARIKSPMMMR